MKNIIKLLLCLMLIILCGCSNQYTKVDSEMDYPASDPVDISEVYYNVYEEPYEDGDVAYFDYSQIRNGYFGACLKEETDLKIKLQIIKDDVTYTYDINELEMKAFPLNMENGTYVIKAFRQIEGTSYVMVYARELYVEMDNDLSVYLYPNQVVDYKENSSVVSKSFEVVKDDTNDLERIYDLFVYTLDTLSYDKEKAEYVRSIYVLPDLEEAINSKQGICFDYAALMVALCRIQHIPAKVIVGYTDIEYHAWAEIYLDSYGWINPKLIFNSEEWSLIDPTFADTGADYEGRYDEVYHY